MNTSTKESLAVDTVELPNEITLPYVEQGHESGVPLVLLHGIAASWEVFEPLLPHLPPSIHVFVPTLRGHGEASRPAEGYRLDDYVEDLVNFMEALEIDSAIIAGHSLGGSIALRFAAVYPEKTLGLVLIGASISRPADLKVQKLWDAQVSRVTEPVDPVMARSFLSGIVPEPHLDHLILDSLEMPIDVWKAVWKARLVEDSTNDPGRVQAPTFIIWGDQDVRSPRMDQEIFESEIPDSLLVIYRGGRHELYKEEPERFAADLTTFIEDITAAVVAVE